MPDRSLGVPADLQSVDRHLRHRAGDFAGGDKLAIGFHLDFTIGGIIQLKNLRVRGDHIVCCHDTKFSPVPSRQIEPAVFEIPTIALRASALGDDHAVVCSLRKFGLDVKRNAHNIRGFFAGEIGVRLQSESGLLGKILLGFGWLLAPPTSQRQHLRPLGPCVPAAGHFRHPLGKLLRQVVHFRAVCLHVVEFPRLVLLGDDLPDPVPHRPVAFVLPINRIAAVQGFSGKRGHQAHALHRLDRFALEHLRIIGLREIYAGRHQIDQMPRLRFQFAFSRNAIRPMGD